MLTLSIILIVIHLAIVIKNKSTVSTELIVSSIAFLVGLNIVIVMFGVSIVSVVFLSVSIMFVWAMDIIKKPHMMIVKAPGGLVVGFAIGVQP